MNWKHLKQQLWPKGWFFRLLTVGIGATFAALLWLLVREVGK